MQTLSFNAQPRRQMHLQSQRKIPRLRKKIKILPTTQSCSSPYTTNKHGQTHRANVHQQPKHVRALQQSRSFLSQSSNLFFVSEATLKKTTKQKKKKKKKKKKKAILMMRSPNLGLSKKLTPCFPSTLASTAKNKEYAIIIQLQSCSWLQILLPKSFCRCRFSYLSPTEAVWKRRSMHRPQDEQI